MGVFYALESVNGKWVECHGKTLDELDKNIFREYIFWQTRQPKESDTSIDEFMRDKRKIKVTVTQKIEPIDE